MASQVEEPAEGGQDAEGAQEPLREGERGGRLGALLGSASSLRQKASPFLSKARQAIVEEAKLVSDDMRDIAGGVREGMNLTKQDLEEQTRGWRSAFGAKFKSFQSKPEDEHTSKLEAVRQNLAMTAKDVQELRAEVMNEVRHSVKDIQQVIRGEEEASGSLDKVRAVFRKAGDKAEHLQKGLKQKLQPEPFWQLPSTCANYVYVEEPKDAKLLQLGGKLKGLAIKGAMKGKEVARKGKEAADRWKSKEAKAEAEQELGDAVFAIGSDEEWSDEEASEAETPSTCSASRAEEER